MNQVVPTETVGSPTPRAVQVITRTIAKEGGFSDAANDRGGATKYGWSLRTLVAMGKLDPKFADEADLNKDGKLDVLDIQAMTQGWAIDAYDTWFYQKPAFDVLPQPFDAALFDQGVWGGTVGAGKLLQQTLNTAFRAYAGLIPLVVDGGVGDFTRHRLALALSDIGPTETLSDFRKAAAARVVAIVAADPTQRDFLAGWLNRAEELGDV